MADYGTEVYKARLAQQEAYRSLFHFEQRDRALARAWRARPGGVTWADLVDAFNEGLPAAMRIKVPTARRAERNYREDVA